MNISLPLPDGQLLRLMPAAAPSGCALDECSDAAQTLVDGLYQAVQGLPVPSTSSLQSAVEALLRHEAVLADEPTRGATAQACLERVSEWRTTLEGEHVQWSPLCRGGADLSEWLEWSGQEASQGPVAFSTAFSVVCHASSDHTRALAHLQALQAQASREVLIGRDRSVAEMQQRHAEEMADMAMSGQGEAAIAALVNDHMADTDQQETRWQVVLEKHYADQVQEFRHVVLSLYHAGHESDDDAAAAAEVAAAASSSPSAVLDDGGPAAAAKPQAAANLVTLLSSFAKAGVSGVGTGLAFLLPQGWARQPLDLLTTPARVRGQAGDAPVPEMLDEHATRVTLVEDHESRETLSESFSIYAGATQVRKTFNLVLSTRSVADLVTQPLVEDHAQRALMAQSLYSFQLQGLVLVHTVPLAAIQHSRRWGEFAQACAATCEAHFEPLNAQFARVREHGAEAGDIFVTRHSNLRDIHCVLHVVGASTETLAETLRAALEAASRCHIERLSVELQPITAPDGEKHKQADCVMRQVKQHWYAAAARTEQTSLKCVEFLCAGDSAFDAYRAQITGMFSCL